VGGGRRPPERARQCAPAHPLAATRRHHARLRLRCPGGVLAPALLGLPTGWSPHWGFEPQHWAPAAAIAASARTCRDEGCSPHEEPLRQLDCSIVRPLHWLVNQKQCSVPQVDFPLGDGDDPHGFACAGSEVNCYYKHKHLRAAFSNIPAAAKDGSNVSTKVGICRSGVFGQTLRSERMPAQIGVAPKAQMQLHRLLHR
jgi:hypothetical protein